VSRRPTDWTPLAGSDPVPGDPDEVERAAKSLADMAEEITRQTANLRKLATAEGWDADAGRTFADWARELSGQLDQAHGRYRTAAGTLKCPARVGRRGILDRRRPRPALCGRRRAQRNSGPSGRAVRKVCPRCQTGLDFTCC